MADHQDEANTSTVSLIKYGRKETETHLLTADNTSVMITPESGELTLMLHRYGKDGKPIETYAFRLCPEDRKRVKAQA
jgi:hypothetical protein